MASESWRTFSPDHVPDDLKDGIAELSRTSGYTTQLIGALAVNIWQFEDITGQPRTAPSTIMDILREAVDQAPRHSAPARLLDTVEAAYHRRIPRVVVPQRVVNPHSPH